jgi:tripartite-type tricarboxylate transporter receptor subunit TctC
VTTAGARAARGVAPAAVVRARILAICAMGAMSGTVAPDAAAQLQAFPNRPVTLVVGSAAGGGVDIVARLLAVRLATSLGHPVIVENRPGAAARIANDYVARAQPDGYTLLINTAAGAVDAAGERPGADPLREFAPVSTIASTPMILVVNPTVPVTDLRQLIARARAMPGMLNYSSSGAGTTGNLYGELFKLKTGTDIVHIAYRGTAPALTALIAGDVELTFVPVPGALQYVRAGRLRALATTGAARCELLPDVPTMAEAGAPGVSASVWYGVLAPAGTAPEIVAVLAHAVLEATASPELKRQLAELGAQPAASTPDEFGRLLRAESARWTEVVKVAGIHTD